MRFLDDLAARRRFGIKPGLETIRTICAAIGNPQDGFPAVHVAGTNGKGAVCAILDAALRASGRRVCRYVSPHLVRINERFTVDGVPASDEQLEASAAKIASVAPAGTTFFEALTAIAFDIFASAKPDFAILECGLGGRLDATNVCRPALSVITRIGLDHCDWLGETVEKIAAEKAGIIKPGVPVVLGANSPAIRRVVEERARAAGAPFAYAPDMASADDVPDDFSLSGDFNIENAVTAIAALSVLGVKPTGFGKVVWPGRFQRIGRFIVDGAHNPPAAEALAASLEGKVDLVAGFCDDKDVLDFLRTIAPKVRKAYSVATNNPRSRSAESTAAAMAEVGMDAMACASLDEALSRSSGETLVCGSLFLAGEALVALGAYPWQPRFDPAEKP